MIQVVLTLLIVTGTTLAAGWAVRRLDRRTLHMAVLAVFLVYMAGNLFFTILSRDMGSGTYLELRPFQSYVRLMNEPEMDFENVSGFFAMLFKDITGLTGIVLNVILYYPLGYLLSILCPGLKKRQVVLIGCLCSLATEVAQYVLAIGWCEMDDLLHNTLGAALGVWVWHLQQKRLHQQTA